MRRIAGVSVLRYLSSLHESAITCSRRSQSASPDPALAPANVGPAKLSWIAADEPGVIIVKQSVYAKILMEQNKRFRQQLMKSVEQDMKLTESADYTSPYKEPEDAEENDSNASPLDTINEEAQAPLEERLNRYGVARYMTKAEWDDYGAEEFYDLQRPGRLGLTRAELNNPFKPFWVQDAAGYFRTEEPYVYLPYIKPEDVPAAPGEFPWVEPPAPLAPQTPEEVKAKIEPLLKKLKLEKFASKFKHEEELWNATSDDLKKKDLKPNERRRVRTAVQWKKWEDQINQQLGIQSTAQQAPAAAQKAAAA